MDAREKPEEVVLPAPSEEANEEPAELLDLVLAEHAARTAEPPLPKRVEGLVVARIVGVDAGGAPCVVFPGVDEQGVPARAMMAITEAEVGRDVALMFDGADRDKPVIMGLMFQPQTPRKPPVFSRSGTKATVDGERLVFSAEREIVLQCGEASITLTRAGKVLVRGTYILSRSSGTHRIQGGSVQIN
jgi:Domain of unknown function (DUF6484)